MAKLLVKDKCFHWLEKYFKKTNVFKNIQSCIDSVLKKTTKCLKDFILIFS